MCTRPLLGKGGWEGEGPGNEADTMEDCIDSALCGYSVFIVAQLDVIIQCNRVQAPCNTLVQ